MATRDIGESLTNAKNTFSSWDGCMSKAYCKWPVIIAIVIGSLILFSLLWCLFRCLCCGAECCCGCLSCCNSCCPSPRRKRDQGYQQAPPTPNPYYNNHQYQPPHQGPVYASGGMGFRSANGNVPQTATFDAPSKNGGHFNEDALPAMPSWDNAASRRVETHEEVEMEKLDHGRVQSPPQGGYAAPGDSLLYKQEIGQTGEHYNNSPYTQEMGQTGGNYDNPPYTQESTHGGDMGNLNANPYHDYQQHRQVSSPSPYPADRHDAVSPYAPRYQNPASPYGGGNTSYFGGGQNRGNEPSVPPSYHTAPSEIVSPVSPQAQTLYPGQPQYQAYSGVGRRPVQGSWREV